MLCGSTTLKSAVPHGVAENGIGHDHRHENLSRDSRGYLGNGGDVYRVLVFEDLFWLAGDDPQDARILFA